MELLFIDINSKKSKPKATIHLTGKLGFNLEAADLMGLSDASYYRIAIDKERDGIKNVYLVESRESESGVAKVAKAGKYYYLNIVSVFDDLKLEYTTYTIMFDIEESSYEGERMFILKKRSKDLPRKGNEKESQNE